MGGEIFEKAQNRLKENIQIEQIRKNIYNLNKLSIEQLNSLYFKLSLVTNVPFELIYEADRLDTIKRLNSIRYWVSRQILLNKNILAFIVHGNKDDIKDVMKNLFKFGIYLPKEQYIKAICYYYEEIKNMTKITKENVYDLIIKNLLINPYGRNIILKNTNLETNNISLEINTIPRTNINDNKNINKEIENWKNDQNIYYEHIKKNRFIITDHTDMAKINKDRFDLSANVTNMIIEALDNPNEYKEIYKDNIISLTFDWIKSNKFSNKSKWQTYADIIITKQNVSKPKDANFNTLYIKNYNWNFSKAIDLNSSINLRKKNFYLDNDRFKQKYILSLPYEWKVIKQKETFLLILAPDIKINNLIAKVKREKPNLVNSILDIENDICTNEINE